MFSWTETHIWDTPQKVCKTCPTKFWGILILNVFGGKIDFLPPKHAKNVYKRIHTMNFGEISFWHKVPKLKARACQGLGYLTLAKYIGSTDTIFCNKLTTFWYDMPNHCVNKSLLLYHSLLTLCVIVYKIYVKQYIVILLHFIPLKTKKKY